MPKFSEIPKEIRGKEFDELTEDEKRANEKYDEAIRNAIKGDTPKDFSNAVREARQNFINDMIDARKNAASKILEKFKTEDGIQLSPESAEFIADKMLSGYSLDANGLPSVRVDNGPNAYNYGFRSIDENGRASVSADSIDLTDSSRRGKFNEYLDKLGGTKPSDNFTEWARQKLGGTPRLRFEKEIKKRLSSDKWNKLTDAQKKMQDSVSKLEEAIKNGDNWKPEDKAKFDEASKTMDDVLKDLGDEWDKKRNADNMDPDAQKRPKSRLEFIYKIMFLLSIVGTALTAIAFLCHYCDNHTGCLKIEYHGSGYQTNNIEYCKGTCMVKGNESGTKNTFLPSQCFCSQYPLKGNSDTKISTPTNKNQCGFASDKSGLAFTPDYNNGLNCKNTKCSPVDGNITGQSDYLYYDYIVMTPFDGALDIGSKVLDLGGDLLQMLLNAAIVIGIIIAVLVVLFIIYKFVSNRGSSETVKVVSAPPAPSVPSSTSTTSNFGKYLGDLSKFSDYGLMGHCGVYDLIPQ